MNTFSPHSTKKVKLYYVDCVEFYLLGGILPRDHLSMWLSGGSFISISGGSFWTESQSRRSMVYIRVYITVHIKVYITVFGTATSITQSMSLSIYQGPFS